MIIFSQSSVVVTQLTIPLSTQPRVWNNKKKYHISPHTRIIFETISFSFVFVFVGSCCQKKYHNQKIQNKLVEYVQLKKRRGRGHDFTTTFIFVAVDYYQSMLPPSIIIVKYMCSSNQQSFTCVCVLFYCTMCILGCCCCSRNGNTEKRNKNGHHGSTSIFYCLHREYALSFLQSKVLL